MYTLGNFFHLRAFINNKLFRMFALCMAVVLFVALGPCANADAFRFTITADNRPNSAVPNAFQQVLSQITQKVGDEGEFHISVGDIDPPLDTYDALKTEFDDNVLWYPVVGNHELDVPSYMQDLRQYYVNNLEGSVNPGPGEQGKGEETSYSWNYGNAHFIVLNEYFGCNGNYDPVNNVCDNTYYDDGRPTGEKGDVTDALFDWLEEDLAATDKDWIFVFGHEPAFPQNAHLTDSLNYYPENRNQFWTLLESKGVTAYICGHTHWYSRYKEPGGQVWQIDVGAAGVDYRTDGYLTFLDVTVSDNQVHFRVYRGTDPTDLSLYESWTNTDEFIIKDLLYTPVAPCKIVDTRNTSAGIIGATPRDFYVFGDAERIGVQGGNSVDGCPSPLGKPLAAHISMVAVTPTGKGNLKAFPVTTKPQRGLSVNYNAIDTNLANAGTVKIRYGSGSDISMASNYSSAHVTIQVLGYYYPDGDFLYTPLTPCKIVDTRNTSAGMIDAGTQRNFYVRGSAATISAQGGNSIDGCPSPLGEPRAAHISMVAVTPTGKGNLKAFPRGDSSSAGLSVNYNIIDTNLANAGTVKTSFNTGSDITVASNYSSAHVTIQVLGYYYPDGDLLYTPVTPCKIADTRITSAGIIDAGTDRDFYVYGSGSIIGAQGGDSRGCPSPLGEPRAAHISMVAVTPTGKGNLKAFPVGDDPTVGLSINYNTIDTNLANAGTVKTITGTGPDITVASNRAAAHTVIEVLGYYYPAP